MSNVEGNPNAPRRFATTAAPVPERLRAWEEWNEQQLFGLRASTLAPEGLLASESNLEIGPLRITEITGNAHVIERSPRNIADKPVDTVMMCLMLSGEAFIYDAEGHQAIRRGDGVLYDSDTPFLYGFTGAMHQVILEVPRMMFHGRVDERGVPRPRVLRLADDTTTTGWAGRAARAMRRALRSPAALADAGVDELLDLQTYLVDPQAAGAAGHLVAAQEYVRTRVSETDLSAARIAAGVGISERHLRRVFADSGLTVAGHVTDVRVHAARGMLEDPARSGLTIAQISRAVGYVSPEHFARVFRGRTGMTPSEVRAAAM